MTYTFKLSRRIARLRAVLPLGIVLAAFGCADGGPLDPESNPESSAPSPALASVSFAGGIPIGTFNLPNEQFGTVYNGALRVIWPEYLLQNLAAIKARGGKVVLALAGAERHYRDAAGHFSLSKWKARVDRYRSVNFASYISDGTVVGHYLIDEPNDPTNWNGQAIPPSVVEEMARYSKERWPGMVTIVRTAPDYLDDWSGDYHYLDAAWAQYVAHRWPDTRAYISSSVAKAQAKGLALVVGLNLLDGGRSGGNMSASEVRTYGSALLSSSYPCAFISWEHNDRYLSTSDMKDAMSYLRNLAENRATKTCRASAASGSPPPPPPPAPAPSDEPLPFGLFQTPDEDYSARWTGAVHRAQPSDLTGRLSRAKSTGMKLIVMLAGTAGSKNSDGTFSLTKWKAQVDRYRSLSLGAYITSKTLYLHYLVEQPSCARCWGGKAISWGTLEEMARYSKSIWPGLPTTVRVAPSALAGASFRWTHLDAGWAEYNTRKGDLRSFLAAEVARARLEGLGLVAGLNLLDGAGYDTAPMTASQIREFGAILAAEPALCAIVGWRHDAAYLARTGVGDALDAVVAAARRRKAASCIAG